MFYFGKTLLWETQEKSGERETHSTIPQPPTQPLSSPSSALAYSPVALPQREHSPGNTHVTGLKGRLLRSDCDCSILIDWFKASS